MIFETLCSPIDSHINNIAHYATIVAGDNKMMTEKL